MGELKDFIKHKNEKEGIVTVDVLIENLYEASKQGLVNKIVYIAIDNEGFIVHGCNTMSSFESMGILEAGKIQILDSTRCYDE